MRKIIKSITLLLLAALLPSICFAFKGKVVGVSDGDTITVMHDGKGERIRIYGVDAPEKSQDFGNRAKKFTSEFAFDSRGGEAG
jgi:micrococcal nuclease